MERIFENYEFIKEMDEDLDELCGMFITEAGLKIYERLLNHYPDYRDMIHQKSQLSNALFGDRLDEDAEYNALTANIEVPINTANFLLGIKLGMKL